jgi:hypothetical protein
MRGQADEPQFQPISMLPVIRDLIDGGLEDITANLANIKAVHASEYGTLDAHTAARYVALFAEGLEFVPIYKEQLARWLRIKLTDTERKEVTRLQGQLGPLEAVLKEGRAIANEMTKRTIEKVVAKSDEQLGLEALLRAAGRKPGS